MSKGELCEICPKACVIPEGHKGFCGARTNREGKIIAANYGKITSMALDPIEKKPLKRFHPGSYILSVGSYGCNLRCPFCQNYDISMGNDTTVYLELTPEELIARALEQIPRGNIGVAYTYNEPLIGYEFVRDCANLAAEKGLENVVVTNGYINEKPFAELLPFIDALNIDLKSFSPEFYKSIGGNLETVKTSIRLAAAKSHVEVTTLVIAGDNDSEEEMRALSSWLATVNPEIPLHISRFFPAYKMSNRLPTSVKTIRDLVEIAQESLRYVYTGNI
ncbi:MAG: AmmeMemoRadiSam system radical SAM enzyme [Ruminococcaceae bacterium]|nr:AmmeMemoRadiSam system radical SAM enzyme [Oscillospiraceae bacterium]